MQMDSPVHAPTKQALESFVFTAHLALFHPLLAIAVPDSWSIGDEWRDLSPEHKLEFFEHTEEATGGAYMESFLFMPISEEKMKAILNQQESSEHHEAPTLLFHGTDAAGAKSICEDGIKPSEIVSQRAKYGKGFYVAANYGAMAYARGGLKFSSEQHKQQQDDERNEAVYPVVVLCGVMPRKDTIPLGAEGQTQFGPDGILQAEKGSSIYCFDDAAAQKLAVMGVMYFRFRKKFPSDCGLLHFTYPSEVWEMYKILFPRIVQVQQKCRREREEIIAHFQAAQEQALAAERKAAKAARWQQNVGTRQPSARLRAQDMDAEDAGMEGEASAKPFTRKRAKEDVGEAASSGTGIASKKP